MIIEKVRFSIKQNNPILEATIDGVKTVIPSEQKALKENAVFIGSTFEDTYFVTLPASPANGQPVPRKLFGFSDDPQLLSLVRQFHQEINSDNYTPRDISLP